MTNEEAAAAKELFADKLGASIGVMVDPIGPVKMKSRTEWLMGTQGGPNFRGVSAAIGAGADVESLMTNGADGVDVLYVCDADFSDRTKDPAVLANLRKAKFLIVQSWDGAHPMNEIADVLLPGTILAEKEGTFTNLQGTAQQIHQAYPPKGQAVTDLELFQRLATRLLREKVNAA
jgi:predicted molibdopterin-dependent oxidoreductase YjgC